VFRGLTDLLLTSHVSKKRSPWGCERLPLVFFIIPQLDPHAAERKLSPAARTGQAQSLSHVRWKIFGLVLLHSMLDG
jgi:hypothetical protein